jgi:hypothetical protein
MHTAGFYYVHQYVSPKKKIFVGNYFQYFDFLSKFSWTVKLTSQEFWFLVDGASTTTLKLGQAGSREGRDTSGVSWGYFPEDDSSY